ncbi:TnsA endonuclease C-terminal domain-containing protein [Lyngbya aestuarii]|uniref:TnsA endonuclease C-terminal domain-containing protein n=1 Tax=Lyngbya aestuarii TaxID=118322 RepID=UPI00403D967F
MTEKHIPRLLAENVGWVHPDYWLEATPEMDVAELRSLASTLKFRLQESDATINKVTTALDCEMNIESGTSLRLFKHMVARKEIVMDMLGTKISSCPSTKAIKRIIF